jgi:short-subunit dehydrogenase
MSSIYSAYKDKVIIVAGGASGIGEHLVRQLSSFAKLVIILDRNKKAGTALAKLLAGTVEFQYVEMKDDTAVAKVLKAIDEKHTIDYFFNTAGSFMAGEIRDTPTKDWQEITNINLQPMINATSAIYSIMLKKRHGHIVNFASSAGLFPVPVMSLYGATKYAVVGMTLGLRMEAKTLKVKVSVVCPTVVETPLYDTAMYEGLDTKKALNFLKNKAKPQQPGKAARRTIEAVAKNKAIIHTSNSTKLGWVLYRLSPSLYMALAQRFFKPYRRNWRSV